MQIRLLRRYGHDPPNNYPSTHSTSVPIDLSALALPLPKGPDVAAHKAQPFGTPSVQPVLADGVTALFSRLSALVRQSWPRRFLHRTKGEEMGMGKTQLFDKFRPLRKICFTSARETDDQIGCQNQIRDGGAGILHQATKTVHGAAPRHAPQLTVRPGLQRQMQMGTKPPGQRCHRSKKPSANSQGSRLLKRSRGMAVSFKRAETKAFKSVRSPFAKSRP